MPVYQFTNASLAAPTGSDPASALGLWMPPTYLENPVAATLTQRGGVDLTLESAASGSAIAGLVDVGRGASITVDPGHSVQLVSASQITVDGTITAHGGKISLLDSFVFAPNGIYNVAPSGPGARSFWIGASAVLDVSGQGHVAQDLNGNSYGVVQDGGSITFGRVPNSLLPAKSIANAADAFIVIAPGALLDASGTSGTLSVFDTTSKSLGGAAGRPVTVASDGGTISLNSYDGIYAEGILRAEKGGAGASGGTLNLTLEAPFVSITSLPYFLTVGRVLMIGQHEAPVPLADGIGPGQVDTSLAIGRGTISADQIEAGGFDTVSLSARSAIAFNGDVSLSAGRSITLGLGALAETVGGGNVSLTAPYIFLDGNFGAAVPTYAGILTTVPDSLTAVTGGTFSATGDLVDVRDAVTSYFADTRLSSRTDLRFLAGITGVANTTPTTNLTAPYGNMELVAEQLYPTSGAIVTVSAGTLFNATTFVTTYVPGATLSIESIDGTMPAIPYSVFGSIALSAPTMRQGGIVRAPLGSIRLGGNALLELLPDSLTSVSAAGLVMPYGGTTDGVSYTVDGAAPVTPNLLTGQYGANAQSVQGISLNGIQVIGDAGSRLDVSGGGSLLGAGFVSGRGGSVDTLTTPLINSNPANSYSAGGNLVYAIVPGVVTAPMAGGYYSAWTGSVPQVGEQITIPAGVPGLPAGTYTLLPANYALLPGGYRVELGAQTRTPLAAPVSVSNGSYLLSGVQSVAHSAIVDALPTQVIVTPGAAVRTTSQYNEQGYDAFERAQAATFGSTRPILSEDGKFLTITLNPLAAGDLPSGPALQFSGTVDFAGAGGGYGGSLVIPTTTGNESDLVITGPGSTTQRSATVTTVAADIINAFNAPNLYIGGVPTVSSGSPGVYFAIGSFYLNGNRGQPVTLEPGAVLSASQVVLTGGTVTLGEGAGIDTLGRGIQAPDSSTGNALATNYAMLVVSNGHMVLDSSTLVPTGNIAIGENAFLYSDGTIGFAAGTGVAFTGTPHLGARELALTMPSINIGDAATLAAARTLPAGLNLDQHTLDLLLHGDPSSGAPAVKTLALTATNSINFYGSTSLDTIDPQTGVSSLDELVLNTPAIYGAGGAGDHVSLTTDTLVWNGYAVVTGRTGEGANLYGSAVPSATIANGPGMGAGTLDINARQIILGYPADAHPPNNVTLDRLMLGFSTVNLNASGKIVADNIGTLNVFQSGPSPDATYSAASYVGTGGALNLITPLLTGDPGAILKIRAGGAVNVTRPAAGAPGTAKPSALGAEIDLTGDSVVLDTAVFLPSGRLSVTATNDLTLGAGAQLNLAGQPVGFFDVTKNTWGGDVLLESTHGNIVQAAGSVIDISAAGADAGSLSLTATGTNAGLVSLGGTLLAGGGSGFDSGSIDIRAQRIGNDPANLTADFAMLNSALTKAGFMQSRSFDLKKGSLVIGDEVKAHAVSVSIDGGSLTVNGTVDASGLGAGSIQLAARGDLVINGTLDAQATTLKTDADGAAIGASNAPDIELTTTDGELTLATGAIIDLRSADGVARGTLTLNAPRVGSTGPSATGAGAPANATGGDIAIRAVGPLDIRGTRNIVLNGFARYANAPTDPDDANGQLVTQGWLDLVDQDSKAFENAALANPDLQGRITGLTRYGSAFHLRPGVEIDSAMPGGNINVSGDVDLSAYRYGPNAGSGTGKGEPISLVLRAGGNLNINGSISDGFAPVAGAPGVYTGLIQDLSQDPNFPVTDLGLGTDVYFDSSGTTYYLAQDWPVPDDPFYRSFGGFYAGLYGSITYTPGMIVPAGTLFVGWNTAFEAGVTPPVIATGVVSLPVASAPGNAPNASPLAPGSMSSSLRLVAGADIASADTRGLQAASVLAGSGNMLLSNQHLTGTLEVASVVRTGDSNLDILAGGNFSQGSIYNISTTGGGDNDPANLFIAVQGNFTSYVLNGSSVITNWLNGNTGTLPYTDGFTGFGALNGGNVTIRVGGNAGAVTNTTADLSTSLVVAATNGDVSLDIGGRLNPNAGAISNGVFTDLRGDLTINAASIGVIPLIYGVNEINDPRGTDPARAALVGIQYQGGEQGGIDVIIGNGTTSLNTRGDLALSLIGAKTTASYWRPTTAVNLFSAGGNVVPVSFANGPDNTYTLPNPGDIISTVAVALPPIFTAVAASGSIYYGSNGSVPAEFRLLPSAAGQLELLAQNSIYGAAYAYSATNLYQPGRFEMEAAETDATLHDGDTNPIRVYAVNGDIVNVVLGETYTYSVRGIGATNYVAAKAADVEAGRDIVSFGRAPNTLDGNFPSAGIVPSLILNTNDTDVSVIRAGRDMFYTDVQIAGPGTLEVSAGRNLYQGNQGSITSIGPIGADAASDPNGGAGVALLAGAGANGPDYAGFAKLYFDNANLADAAIPDSDPLNAGKVPATYQDQLYAWLRQRFGYEGSEAGALAYFLALPTEQQGVFARQIFYEELDAGGKEYNDATSKRFQSYLRGRDAIAALFPNVNAAGNPITYSGNITMFGASGVQTQFGGAINVLSPGGQTEIGAEGPNPPGSAGLITQGSGDIDVYSLGSVLLGQSRIMTTFGGDILVWSAEGDINAGRGAKTTVVYTAPRRVSDNYGRVTLSPVVPSFGAGIATLNPIPEVPRGDINLIAPLGTIDAGEAGIRVSGNVNLAALQVVNAANIQVQGTSAGLPTVQGPPVAALTSASNTAAATQQSVQSAGGNNTGTTSVMIVEIIGYGGGDGGTPDDGQDQTDGKRKDQRTYNTDSPYQVLGVGALTDDQVSSLAADRRASFQNQ